MANRDPTDADPVAAGGANGDAELQPAVDEVVQRLDQLWADNPVAPPKAGALALLVGQRLGQYTIHEVIGRGAFGVVYRAADEHLGRDVALKIPRPEVLLDQDKLRRFEAEATTAAALNHPLIVSVYEGNLGGPTPYIATAYCAGPDLGRWLSHRARAVAPRDAAAFVADLTDAVAFAHQQGVLHRDLKPGNVLLEPVSVENRSADLYNGNRLGELTDYEPRLSDFGLAKLIENSFHQTRSSLLVGTPLYMAPEQLSGIDADATPMSDVYALGVILFELLTLKTPFEGSSYVEVLDSIRRGDPPGLRQLNPAAPPDLETICLKCIQRDPSRRYGTASALAEDLRRYLSDQPIAARPPTVVDRLNHWSRRQPSWAWFTAVLLILTAGGLLVRQRIATRANQEVAVAESRAETASYAAEATQRRISDLRFVSDVQAAYRAYSANRSTEARERLSRHIPAPGGADRRGFAWHYLWNQLQQETKSLTGHGPVFDVVFSPDGATVASAHEPGKVVLRSVADGKVIHEWAPSAAIARKVAFSRNGDLVAAAFDDGLAAVWQIADGQRRFATIAHEGGCDDVAFLPDNRRIATGGDRLVKLFEIPPPHPRDQSASPKQQAFPGNAVPQTTLRDCPGRVYAVDVASNGRWLLAAGERDTKTSIHGFVSLYDLHSGDAEKTEEIHFLRKAYSGRFSPSGDRFAIGTQSGQVLVWDTSTQEELANWSDHTSNVYDLAFSADDQWLLSASKDSSARIWSVASRRPLRSLRSHTDRVYGVAFSAHGSIVATASRDGSIKLWKTGSSAFSHEFITNVHGVAKISPDSRTVVASCWAGDFAEHVIGSDGLRPLPLMMGGSARIAWQRNGVRCVLSGNGVVRRQIKSAATPSPPQMRIDLDADGDDDLLSALGEPPALLWQERLDNGATAPPRLYAPPNLAYPMHQVDSFQPSDDGRLDVLGISSRPGIVHLNRHGFRKRDLQLVTKLKQPADLACADLNGDGRADLIIATQGDNSVWWGEQLEPTPGGQARVRKLQRLTNDLAGAATVAAADLNGDERPDIVAAGTRDARVVWFENLGDGNFTEPHRFEAEIAGPKHVEIFDLDRDRSPEVVVASLDALVAMPNYGRGKFGAPEQVDSLADSEWATNIPETTVVYNTVSKEVEHELPCFASVANISAISPNGALLAVADDENVIRVWSLPSERYLQTILVGKAEVADLEFSPNGTVVAAAVGDDLHVWNCDDFSLKFSREEHDNSINRIAFADDGRRLATTSDDLTIRLWSLPSGKPGPVLIGHQSAPVAATFSPDGRVLASGATDGMVRIFDTDTGQELLTLEQMVEDVRPAPGVGDLQFDGPLKLVGLVHNSRPSGIALVRWRADAAAPE